NEMCEFIYGVRTTKGKKYSRASLKNAVASISCHLKNPKPQWNYNLLCGNLYLEFLYLIMKLMIFNSV
ncbi:8571_t:CDS:1, partial [Funneliformis geosporum]